MGVKNQLSMYQLTPPPGVNAECKHTLGASKGVLVVLPCRDVHVSVRRYVGAMEDFNAILQENPACSKPQSQLVGHHLQQLKQERRIF